MNLIGKMLTISFIVLCVGSVSVHSMIYVNYSDGAFGDPPSSGSNAEKVTNHTSIAELIVRGAGYFLKSSADINTMSERYEMTEIEAADYYGLYNAADSAVQNLEMALGYYQQLVSTADNTPYKLSTIDRLVAFDYQAFQTSNGLNKDMFGLVEHYLSAGDVRGVYRKIQKDLTDLLKKVKKVRLSVYWGYLPTTKEIWDINQDNLNIHLFGQYITRVFEAK